MKNGKSIQNNIGMHLVSSSVMEALDHAAQKEYNIPGILLMENAGTKGYAAYLNFYGKSPGRELFVAGAGNNGGDALVMAREALVGGGSPNIIIIKEKGNAQFETHLAICRSLSIPIAVWDNEQSVQHESCLKYICESEVIFDGIAGTGIKGPLKGASGELVKVLNQTDGYKVAIDIPSGGGDAYQLEAPLFKADLTLTMGLPKNALYFPAIRSSAGTVLVVRLGFPPALLHNPPAPGNRDKVEENADTAAVYSSSYNNPGILLSLEEFPVTLFPDRPKESYKNSRGHVGIYAGSSGYSGAAKLAASGAAFSGAGLVTLQVDPEIYQIAAAAAGAVMVRPLESSEMEHIIKRFSALAVGPGWTSDGKKERGAILRRLLASDLPGVLDADALTVLTHLEQEGYFFCKKKPDQQGPDRNNLNDQETIKQRPDQQGPDQQGLKGKWVLTPHIGEMARLAGCSKNRLLENPLPVLLEQSDKWNAVIVMKSHVNWIVSPDKNLKNRFCVVDGMNPSLGTGGSGDVLAGLISGLLAQGLTPFSAACLGVWVHQKAGAELAAKAGWFTADMLPAVIGSVLGQY